MSATDGVRTRVVAVSADATLLDLHLTLLGAFEWDGDFSAQEAGAYHIEFATRSEVFTAGRGSRTRLRGVLADGERFICEARGPHIIIHCTVLRTYEVAGRRHHPKVLDADGNEADARIGTWKAQSASRREFRYAIRRENATPSLEYVHGMFSAILAGPLVMPSEWLPVVAGIPNVFELYNEVAQDISEAPDRFIEQTLRGLATNPDHRAIEQWVRGFVHGMALNGAAWQSVLRDAEFRQLFEPIAAVMEMYDSPAKRDWLRDRDLREKLSLACPIAAVELARYWRRRQG